MKKRLQIRLLSSFTLIELLVVVAILGLLAGLLLAAAGGVRNQAARSQAKAEIAALEAGLARYQMDFAAYPTSNITTNSGVYPLAPSSYSNAGTVLFAALWGSSSYGTASGAKQYLSVKPSMVNTNGANYFKDPWNNAYGYFWSGTVSLYGVAVPDVWSTGGQNGSGSQTNRAKWVTSWD